MPSVFTKIIDGEFPGTFVWRDEVCVAFLSIAPIRVGHTLVVPRVEVDHWIDLDVETVEHLMGVAHAIGRAQREAFHPTRVGLIVAGMEVPHTHIHVLGIDVEADLDFRNSKPTTPEELTKAATPIRAALRDLGYEHVADE
jgi:histidine triad (HIT) family protein